jgi:hypothetical protein
MVDDPSTNGMSKKKRLLWIIRGAVAAQVLALAYAIYTIIDVIQHH